MDAMFIVTTTIIIACFLSLNNSVALNTHVPPPPPTFIFGDSLLDVGNNNYIHTLSKANYVPNGIDFGYPTGRFTNGRTIADIIDQELGRTNFTPAYLAPTTTGPDILKGVNYASGAGGILNETGDIFVGRINLDAQIDNFANTRQDIIRMIGEVAAQKLLKTAIFVVSMGSNDFINNYLLHDMTVSPHAFVLSMISRFRVQLTRLYRLGGRKMLVPNVGPIGCIPYTLDKNASTAGNDSCVAFPNQLAQSYNSQMKSLLSDLSSNLEGSFLVYGDIYNIVWNIIQNHTSYGFENANSACCHIAGVHGGQYPCLPPSKVCEDRDKYVFWDAYHPSDAANVIVAKRILYGDTKDMSPFNMIQLLQR